MATIGSRPCHIWMLVNLPHHIRSGLSTSFFRPRWRNSNACLLCLVKRNGSEVTEKPLVCSLPRSQSPTSGNSQSLLAAFSRSSVSISLLPENQLLSICCSKCRLFRDQNGSDLK
ncbi:hypothetical protein ACLOJK_035777 [Asimina triloba]